MGVVASVVGIVLPRPVRARGSRRPRGAAQRFVTRCEMMVTAVNHEITPREPHNGYLILQGGLPEVEAFVKQHWK